jgi:hypothetical protein
MANHYYIISEVQFYKDKNNKSTLDFVSGTGIDLNVECKSKTPSLSEIKNILLESGLETKVILKENDRIEIMATQNDRVGLWLIFTEIKDEVQETNMFEVGRGSDPDLTIAFLKSLTRTHGNFLYYCDSGSMSLVTTAKDVEQIRNEIYN